MIVPQKSAQPIAASHWLVAVRFVDSMEQQQVVLGDVGQNAVQRG